MKQTSKNRMKQTKKTTKPVKKARDEKTVPAYPKYLSEADRKAVARIFMAQTLAAIEHLDDYVYDQIPERLWDKYHDGETIIKEFNADSLKRIVKTAFHLEYGIR